MNLHGIVSPAIGAINPHVLVTLRVSTGYTIDDATAKQVPTYAADRQVSAQVQSMSARDIRQVEALNLQNIQNTIYLSGEVDGIVRADNKGGDLIIMRDGTVWLVVAVLEGWPDWVKVAVTMQNNN